MKKTTELLPLLVNKGGAVLHCGLWKRAGRAVSLSTRSVHTPWLVPTGPPHRPVIMWLSALFRTVCCFRAWAFQFGLKRSCLLQQQDNKEQKCHWVHA